MKLKLPVLLVCSSFGLLAHAKSPQRLSSYSEIVNSLTEAHRVKVVMDLKHCVSIDSPDGKKTKPGPDVVGGMEISLFNKYFLTVDGKRKETLATSTNTLIEHSEWGPVVNYIRIRFFKDQSVEFTSSYYKPQDYTTLSQTHLKCAISSDTKESGIKVFQL